MRLSGSVDRNALQALLLAGLCVVVVVFAAATLTDTTTPGGGLGFGGDGSSGFGGSGGDGLAGEDGEEGGRGLPINNSTGGGSAGGGEILCVEWLKGSDVAGALVMALILFGGAVAYVRNYVVGLGAMLVVGWPGLILYILLTACGGGVDFSGSLSPDGDGQAGSSGSGVPGTGDAVADPSVSTILLVIAGVLVVGVLVAFALGAGEDDEEEEDEETGESKRFTMPDLAAVGEAAGDAADRIETTEAVDNEVYRAWREMTDQLNVPSPETSTPAEFRDAAVAAGMDPDDVARLTDLFEEVRYGEAEATDARERAAVDVLRRIEAAYGDGGDGE